MIEQTLKRTLGPLNSLAVRIQAWADAWDDARLAKRLTNTDDFAFTEDFVANNIPHWEEHLAPFRGRPGVAMLEIGSHEGRSAVWFLKNILTDPSSSIVCVDPFSRRGIEPRFDHNIRMSGEESRVEKIKNTSAVVLPQMPEKTFEIIYIDGDHRAAAVLMDAHLCWRLLEPGGVLIFDDYAWEPEKPAQDRPQPAIDMFLAAYRDRFDLLHQSYQVIVRKREVDSPGIESSPGRSPASS